MCVVLESIMSETADNVRCALCICARIHNKIANLKKNTNTVLLGNTVIEMQCSLSEIRARVVVKSIWSYSYFDTASSTLKTSP